MNIEQAMQEESVPVVIADDEDFIVHVNAPLEALFGWRREELVGQPLTTLIPSTLRDAHNLGFSRFLLTGKATLLDRPITLRAVTKDGAELEAEHVIFAEQREGRWMFGATIRPLDQR